MHRVVGQGSFAEALVRGGDNARLEAIASLLDWARLEVLLQGIHSAREGRPSYPPLVLVKVLLLQGWYGLGDPAMEEALGDRISFRRFCGLSLEAAVPDHSTISRFCTLITDRGLAEALFEEVGRQLDARGQVVKAGTLIDASVVPAAAAEPPGRPAAVCRATIRMRAGPGGGPGRGSATSCTSRWTGGPASCGAPR